MRGLMACVLLGTASSVSFAGSLGVGPTLIELTTQRPVAVLKVRNTGDATAIVQLETVAWSQAEGSDQYTPTEEIAATPEVFELEPGVQREIRVGLRATDASAQERSYRVYVREVQSQTNKDQPQLSFAVRIGVPVFASPVGRQDEAQLSWRLVPNAGGCPRLVVRNDAAHRQRIGNLQLLAEGKPIWEDSTSVYILAGASRTVELGQCESIGNARELRITGESQTVTLPAAK